MLKRAVEVKEALFLLQGNKGAQQCALTHEEWSQTETALKLLQPLYEATVEMSSEQMVTASKVVPMVKTLQGWYAQKTRKLQGNNPSFAKQFCDFLLRTLNRRFDTVEDVQELCIATLLDPRFKKEGFKSPEKASRAVTWVKEQLNISSHQLNEDLAGPTNSENSRSEGLWSKFDAEVQANSQRHTGGSDTRLMEVRRYLELANSSRESTNPLEWWQSSGKPNFPHLNKMATKYLVIQATSVPCERVFSSAGNILTQKRSCLSDKNASMYVFLHGNLK